MYKKIIAVSDRLLKAYLRDILSSLGKRNNIFMQSDAEQYLKVLVSLRESGVDLRKEFSVVEGLYYLNNNKRPMEKEEGETEEMFKARVSIYNCLSNLDKKNMRVVLEHLERDLLILGFKMISPTHYDITTKLIDAVKKGDLQGTIEILNLGANIHSRDDKGRTTLMLAALNKHPDIVSALLEKGADISMTDNSKSSNALLYAAEGGDIECIRLLLKAGSDINYKNSYNWTALMTAADSNKPEAVRFLKGNKADLHIISHIGQNAMHLAVRFEEVVDALLEITQEDIPIKKPKGIIGWLKPKVIDDTKPDQNKKQLSVKDREGKTALTRAADFSFDNKGARVVKRLLEAGADINEQDHKGRTALISAVICGCEKGVKVLMEAGADRTITDNEGKNALDHAEDLWMKLLLKPSDSGSADQDTNS
ncbi:MAG: ankyrin repeat domain-containing protein [Candidatus Margulisbacteria bacterium]|nr:ankyrin repeat domain-containing protein [Candidatus Margulisiibacteriota bacterium]